jgi:hypothetical protein
MNSNTKSRRRTQITPIICFLFCLSFCLNFYWHISKVKYGYFVDLRNRVVGARLIKQDLSPYFFKWNPSYPETLLDPIDKCNIKNNMITSPPSVLMLMNPIADLNYGEICYWWTAIQYFFFLLIIAPLYFLSNDIFSRAALLATAIVLLFSDFWTDSIFRGQSHFIFPAILANILLVESWKSSSRYWIIGILLSLLVWTRPNTLLIVPFFIFCIGINRKRLFFGFIGGGLFLVAITLLFRQQYFWIDFYNSCKEWIQNNASGMNYASCSTPKVTEGKSLTYQDIAFHWKPHSQISDLFFITKIKFHFLIKQVYLFSSFSLVYLFTLFIYLKKPAKSFSEALFAGVFLYWILEMTTPILKMSYYYVELFVVVLFLASKFKELHIKEQILLVVALVLPYFFFLPMNLVIAELFTMACLFCYLYRMKYSDEYLNGGHI